MSLRASTKNVTKATKAATAGFVKRRSQPGNFVFQSYKRPGQQLVVRPRQALTEGKVVDVAADARPRKTLHSLQLEVQRPGRISTFSSGDMIPAIIDAILNETPSDQATWSSFPPGLDLAARFDLAVRQPAAASQAAGDYSVYTWVAKRYKVKRNKRDKVQGQTRNRPANGRRTSTAV